MTHVHKDSNSFHPIRRRRRGFRAAAETSEAFDKDTAIYSETAALSPSAEPRLSTDNRSAVESVNCVKVSIEDSQGLIFRLRPSTTRNLCSLHLQ